MLRILAATLIVAIAPAAGHAAAALTADSAAKTIASVAGDAAKLKAFCAMNRVLNIEGDEQQGGLSEAQDKEIESYLSVLGPEFRAAWDFGVAADAESADGKTIDAAIEDLEAKCDK